MLPFTCPRPRPSPPPPPHRSGRLSGRKARTPRRRRGALGPAGEEGASFRASPKDVLLPKLYIRPAPTLERCRHPPSPVRKASAGTKAKRKEKKPKKKGARLKLTQPHERPPPVSLEASANPSPSPQLLTAWLVRPRLVDDAWESHRRGLACACRRTSKCPCQECFIGTAHGKARSSIGKLPWSCRQMRMGARARLVAARHFGNGKRVAECLAVGSVFRAQVWMCLPVSTTLGTPPTPSPQLRRIAGLCLLHRKSYTRAFCSSGLTRQVSCRR